MINLYPYPRGIDYVLISQLVRALPKEMDPRIGPEAGQASWLWGNHGAEVMMDTHFDDWKNALPTMTLMLLIERGGYWCNLHSNSFNPGVRSIVIGKVAQHNEKSKNRIRYDGLSYLECAIKAVVAVYGSEDEEPEVSA